MTEKRPTINPALGVLQLSPSIVKTERHDYDYDGDGNIDYSMLEIWARVTHDPNKETLIEPVDLSADYNNNGQFDYIGSMSAHPVLPNIFVGWDSYVPGQPQVTFRVDCSVQPNIVSKSAEKSYP